MNNKFYLLKPGDDGLSQIAVRFQVSRTNRPRVKTGIFIHPGLWDEKAGYVKAPRKGRINLSQLEEISKVDEQLKVFCINLSKVVKVGMNNVEINNLWLSRTLELISSGYLVNIDSYADVLSAEKAMKIARGHSISAIGNKTFESSDGSTNFYDLILKYCERHNLSESRVRVYKVLARQLKRFELYVKYTVNPYFRLNYNTMSNDDIEEFRVYLKKEYKLVETNPKIYKKIFDVAPQAEGDRFKKNKISERSSNYISGILKKLASVFHWLQEIGRTANDPFKGVDFGKVLYGRPIYINKEERDIIANFDLTSKDTVLQQQRDIFVFQCLVGCRVGDLLRLTKANITGESGNVLEYVPSKTKSNEDQIKVRVPLNNMAMSLVEKYIGSDRKGRLFPFITAQNYNERIKQIFKICGITRIVQVRNPKTGKYDARPINEIASSHMARRTFCGIGYKLTHDPNLIGKMSGHVEGSKAFARYRDIDDDDLRSITNLM